MSRRSLHILALSVMPLVLAACGQYHMEGKVIEGPRADIMVVSDSDPRLQAAGISGASIEATLDPRLPSRKTLGRNVSGADGTFAMPISELGAGAFEYEIGVLCRAKGHAYIYDEMMMPGWGKRVLIILPRGADTYQRQDDPLGESKRFLPPSP